MSANLDIEQLQRRLAVVEKERDDLKVERDAYRKLHELVEFELARLKRLLFGQKAEKVSRQQMQLAFGPVLAALSRAENNEAGATGDVDEELAKLRSLAEEAEAKRNAKARKPRSSHGRRKLSLEDIPVEKIVLEPAERLAPGGDKLVKIGEEVAEHIDHRPASLIRIQVVRPKYKAPSKEGSEENAVKKGAPLGAAPVPDATFLIADVPERPLPRSIAGPGLLARVLVNKFADHLPLHRQERIFAREGFRIPRSTTGDWVAACSELLSRVTDAMWEDARQNAPWVCADATGVLVQAKKKCRRGHFWVVVAGRDHVLYRYTPKHNGEVAADLLQGFKGHAHVDACSVYHELFRREPDLVEVGCWAHARRKFFDALPTNRDLALIGIGFIGFLYDAQDVARDLDSGVVDAAVRAKHARPVLRKLFAWAKDEVTRHSESAPIRKALSYLINQRVPLERFLDNGQMRLDNNISELELRREVVGRKNWTFCGSDNGAVANAIITSLVASCEMHAIEPWAYLRDVLTLLPAWSQTRVLQLAPKCWEKTRQQPETQKLLADLSLHARDDVHDANATRQASD